MSKRSRVVISGLVIALLAVLGPGTAVATQWPTYAGGPRRLFFNPSETTITAANVDKLKVKWTFRTGAVVTGSPSVVDLDIPGEGRIAVAFIQSWDGNLYALRARNGTELWRFAADIQDGKSYPNASSADVRRIGGRDVVYFGAGETVYCVDAVSGVEVWRFDAGTGCVDPPGLCAFGGERNEVESSPIIADGKVFFGMDVNDVEVGKGGVYAVDAVDGRMVWFFDLESGETCHTLPGEDIRRYDGYHTEADLGLPAGFSGRPGCDFDRTGTGCGNVWSSASIDETRGVFYIASSNCDTDSDPNTARPPPPMPPYDAAIFALDFDGNPVWRWRPREVDNDDLSFGGVPNLFTIDVDVGGSSVARDVVGVGNKDATYYVLDRDGINVANGARWDDADPSSLPYWTTQVVPGGSLGGIIATAAVDEGRRQIYFSTAPGFDPLAPQRPTVHALDMDTGSIVWENTAESNADASFAPTSAVPGAVFAGSVLSGRLRAYDPDTGAKLLSTKSLGLALASAPALVDGLAILGAGVGERTGNSSDAQDIVSRLPHNVTALCVPGTPACEGLSTFSCYEMRTTPGTSGFDPIAGLSLEDRFGSRTASVERPITLCNPAYTDGEDPAAPSDPDHLGGYDLRRSRQEPRFRRVRAIEVTNFFGVTTVDAVKPKSLLVPSAMSLVDDPPDLPSAARIDHFQCYRVRRTKGTPRFQKLRGVTVVDELGTMIVDVLRPTRLCAPVDVDGGAPGAGGHTNNLMCYRTKMSRGAPRFSAVSHVFVNDQFGPETIDALRPRLLCVRSMTNGSAVTTTTTTTSTTVAPSSTTSTTLLFTWADVHNVLTSHCLACHGGTENNGGLGGLDDFDQAYANMVNVPSIQLPAMILVKPFNALDSYLQHKLDGTHPLVGGSGGQMPPGFPLDAGDRNGIRAWINAGAKKFGSPGAAFLDGVAAGLFGGP